MQFLTPPNAPSCTVFGTMSLEISEGSTMPVAPIGSIVWSSIVGTIMRYNGLSWSSGAFPTTVPMNSFASIGQNTQQISAATMTILGEMQVDGTVMFI